MPVPRIRANLVSSTRLAVSTPRRLNSSTSLSANQVDSQCIPTQPTWSVHDLLASYPRPSIPPEMLTRLHNLSALIPPKAGTAEHQKLTEELEDMVKLVEAVKLVDKKVFEGLPPSDVPDGRVWADGEGIDLSVGNTGTADPVGGGRSLLKHAARTANDLYVVEADKHKS